MFVKFHIKTAITGLNELVRVTLEQNKRQNSELNYGRG